MEITSLSSTSGEKSPVPKFPLADICKSPGRFTTTVTEERFVFCTNIESMARLQLALALMNDWLLAGGKLVICVRKDRMWKRSGSKKIPQRSLTDLSILQNCSGIKFVMVPQASDGGDTVSCSETRANKVGEKKESAHSLFHEISMHQSKTDCDSLP